MVDDGIKLRRHPRLAAKWNLEFTAMGWQESTQVETTDLSMGGALIRTRTQLPTETKVQLVFVVPGHEDAFVVFAKVVRTVTPDPDRGIEAGLGVEFEEPPAAFAKVLQDTLAQESEKQFPTPPTPVSPGLTLPDVDDEDIADASPTVMAGEGWWKDGLEDLRQQFQSKQSPKADLAPGPSAVKDLSGAVKDLSPVAEPTLVEKAEGAPIPILLDPSAIDAPDPESLDEDLDLDPTVTLAEGWMLLRNGEVMRVQEAAHALIEEKPDAVQPKVLFHCATGLMHMAMEDQESAILHWQDALALDPECAFAIKQLRALGVTQKEQVEAKVSWFKRLFGGGFFKGRGT